MPKKSEPLGVDQPIVSEELFSPPVGGAIPGTARIINLLPVERDHSVPAYSFCRSSRI